ncbi:low molecular weight phosphotyrosine protein phosphatase [Paraburkholderia bannensis]|uniref:protein-tyrosine-phosphatase n=1 Tax=Paraburkholderia tropica TaxID=92647 RepID=A0AAQ1JXB9_9BURK|nr:MULTISPECIES: low molecular weight protein-tyrosine-phosphatase [Paraburkholderia]QNB12243.1 low molecular weight phosphotyrosine protein phosphatase [Paraburkholderia tropica]RQM49615.1 low molecular weight phosphotyrosine protein phosphatase [Paraburkholderia bannensis]RQN36684.1 low molecular weight phosphotyrosine protein phosphatase [Paraburkholderia tropica]SEK11567.1 protein tyrosine phosphatase [Paraburkholderia tropica]
MIGQILVVCEGNICRSPMGEAMFRKHGYRAASAGLSALVGHGAAEHACDVMSARGIDISAHRSQQITEKLCSESDLILVMDLAQRRRLESRYPTARGKVFRLGEHVNVDIVDPYRLPRPAFAECESVIASSVDSWLAKLAAL